MGLGQDHAWGEVRRPPSPFPSAIFPVFRGEGWTALSSYSNKLVYYIGEWSKGKLISPASYLLTYQNQIDIVNSDLQLSEIKHHFILRKVKIPHDIHFQEFALTLPKGFTGCKVSSNSISFIQIGAKYKDHLFDILVGFKKDREALSVY